jgi:hypothetical protein
LTSLAPRGPSTRSALVFLTVLVAALTLYANASFLVDSPAALRFFPPFVEGFDGNANRHLGAEYWNIARALLAGRGFADPFGAPSGPTAWMPPLYPYLLAGLRSVTESRTGVVVAVVVLQGLTWVLSGWVVFVAARRHAERLCPKWALLAYASWITAHFDWFFQITHDVWLGMLVVDGLLLGGWALLAGGFGPARALASGVFGGVALLASPALGAAFGAATLFVGWKRRAAVGAALALVVAGATGSLWVARNHAVFGRWMFMKSNLAYDAYQASYVATGGVYDEPFLLRHPVWNTARASDSLYRSQGEAAFLDHYRAELAAAVRADPWALARGAGQRLLAATLVYRPYRPLTEGEHPPLRTLLHPLPLVGLGLLFWRRRARLPSALQLALLLWAVALAPYVLAAFYVRYLLPLTPVLVLFAFLGADAVARGAVDPGRVPAHTPRMGPQGTTESA